MRLSTFSALRRDLEHVCIYHTCGWITTVRHVSCYYFLHKKHFINPNKSRVREDCQARTGALWNETLYKKGTRHVTESSSAVTGRISVKKVHSKAYVVTELRS